MKLLGIFPLVREIVSQAGDPHFRRWKVFQTRWANLYVHHILRSDEDLDPHNHPWWFASLVLRGGYVERVWRTSDRTDSVIRCAQPGNISVHPTTDYHKIALISPTWTLVLTGPRTNDLWGYLTRRGWVDHLQYRAQKRGPQHRALPDNW